MAEPTSSAAPLERRLPPDVQLRRRRYRAARAGAWRARLAPEERTRLDGYGVAKRRREFLLGRVAARELLAEHLRCAPAEVPLAVADDGAVDVEGGEGLRLSISHAEAEAVAVVGRRTLGVDLEAVAPRPERLYRYLLAEEERPLLGQLPMSEAEAFVLAWTLKEAVLKALRCGLRRTPKIVRLAEVDAAGGTARLDVRGEGLFEARFERDRACWLTVAYRD